MQVVSYSDLQKLVDPQHQDSLAESFFFGRQNSEIAPGFSFKDVCKQYENHQKEILTHASQADFKQASLDEMMHSWLKDSILKKHCPPIKLVGIGSSRTVYACLGGKCLKVAQSAAGRAQNKQEAKTTSKSIFKKVPECFVQTYASSKKHELLLSECCALVDNDADLAKALGAANIEIFQEAIRALCTEKDLDATKAISKLFDEEERLRRQAKDFSSMLDYADIAGYAASWLKGIKKTSQSRMTPGQRSISQILEFWEKNGLEELMPGDVMTYRNWGFAIRRGQITPVMLDCGFSKDVASEYYE